MRKVTKKKLLVISISVVAILIGFETCSTHQVSQIIDISKPVAPNLILGKKNIVTSQNDLTNEPCGGGRLRVWSFNNGNYENTWTAQSFNYWGVAIGDIDGDIKREIIALASCKMTERKGKFVASYLMFFISAYKEDEQVSQNEMGIWKSTYYDDLSNNIREAENFLTNEITLADVDGDNISEIIIITSHRLAIYKYDPKSLYKYNNSLGAFKKLVDIQPSILDQTLQLNSVTVKDLDGNAGNEIIVSANRERIEKHRFYELRHIDEQGYVLVYSLNNGSLALSSYLSVNAFLTNQSIRASDLDNDTTIEICSTGYKKVGDFYYAYIFIWDYTSEWVCNEISLGPPEYSVPWNHLEVGELNASHEGDEIVFALGHLMQVTLCYWKGGTTFKTINNAILYDYYNVFINRVYIADSDGDKANDIIVIGSGKSGPESGRFYLEIFDENLLRKWYRLGGTGRESGVLNAAIG